MSTFFKDFYIHIIKFLFNIKNYDNLTNYYTNDNIIKNSSGVSDFINNNEELIDKLNLSKCIQDYYTYKYTFKINDDILINIANHFIDLNYLAESYSCNLTTTIENKDKLFIIGDLHGDVIKF